MTVVDQARALIVEVLNEAASREGIGDASRDYLKRKALRVAAAEGVTIESYLVLDCVIAALSPPKDL